MKTLDDRVLLHLDDGRRVPVEPDEVLFLEAEEGNTLVRTRNADRLTDVRQLSVMGRYEVCQLHRILTLALFIVSLGCAVSTTGTGTLRVLVSMSDELPPSPEINVFVLAKKSGKVTTLEPLDGGIYETELGTGTYQLDAIFPGSRSCGPYTVPVRANRVSEVDLFLRFCVIGCGMTVVHCDNPPCPASTGFSKMSCEPCPENPRFLRISSRATK